MMNPLRVFKLPGLVLPFPQFDWLPEQQPLAPLDAMPLPDLILYDGDQGGAAKAGPQASAPSGPAAGSVTVSSASHFLINISWDSSVQSAPAGFKPAILAAASYLESLFTDAVTLNVAVGYGEVHGTSLGSSTLGANQSFLSQTSYASLRNALAADATSADDSAALASLPLTSPVGGTLWTTSSEAKALGLKPANGTGLDGYIGFSSALPFTYNNTSGVAAGTYDFNGVALHEFTEVMGRIVLDGTGLGGSGSNYVLADLFHYSSPGARDLSASTAGYFSINGGITNLGSFNTLASGDPGDWSSAVPRDSFDAFSSSGVVNQVSANDLRVMDAIGWNLAAGGGNGSSGSPAPTGAGFTALTAWLASGQSATGLAAGLALASVTQRGGPIADSYSFALGGADASRFALTSKSGGTSLSVGAAPLAGTAGGQLYAITVSTTDSTTAAHAPLSPLAIIVGNTGPDTVNVAALTSGLGAAAPAFVFALAGADHINGAGVTGHLWLDGGAGADVMTGGAGGTTYVYAAPSDSTATAMDVITNFHTSTDLLDFTGLGQHLTVAGPLLYGYIAGASIGWQVSGGNTFVYINTSGAAASLGGASMKIELEGNVGLSAAAISHL